ncbi:MAG: hypothetical protein H0U28_16660 [Nocardioidaceae bacterium]|nr:hypothetical protein [Nocardioidaceae bacterium]
MIFPPAATRRLVATSAALVVSCWATPSALADPSAELNAPSAAADRPSSDESLPRHARQGFVAKTDDDALERRTGLTVTIDNVEPVSITAGEPLELSGTVANTGTTLWKDAQVYLAMDEVPATTKAGLADFAATDEAFGSRVTKYGLFDEIGAVPPDRSKAYQLSVPYGDLPIESRAPGVYHVGVHVLAGNRDGRDLDSDARADTLMPSIPQDLTGLPPTRVVTLIPVTAGVLRHADGDFVDDQLARQIAFGGRLRNLLDFAAQAPPDSLQLVVDPALRDAVAAMADGYVVRSLRQDANDEEGSPGSGSEDATIWLADLDSASERHHVLLMPWGNPHASALAGNEMAGIVDAAVLASTTYAASEPVGTLVAGWQTEGESTRRGLAASAAAGTSLQIVAQRNLVGLQPVDDAGYLPTVAAVTTRRGPVTTLVSTARLASQRLGRNTSALQFRQGMLAETTVRSLTAQPEAESATVLALPFRWDPGPAASITSLAAAYDFPLVTPQAALREAETTATPYAGQVVLSGSQPGMPQAVLEATARLRDNGRTLVGLLTESRREATELNQQLGVAGSSFWQWRPRRAEILIRRQARESTMRTSQVTVTGPTFVALSSESGRFPLTITNDLDVSVTLDVVVSPQNPALQIEPIEDMELAAGQRRDIDVLSRADGSGLTPVRVRLSTVEGRKFGAPWDFNVRATQIGVAIWVVMGVGAAVLFIASGFRILRRIRTSSLKPREKPSP